MTTPIEVDALVVGAGFGGIYATYRLSRMQPRMKVQTIDMAGDVGGTWYWNRYPGAMSDTESYLYRYSWDKDDLKTYPWSQHYVYQPEILRYLQHVVEKHDLRKYMLFNCEMQSASWDETLERWRVECSSTGINSTGTVYHARYLVNSLGVLSKANYPDIPGLRSYDGITCHTAKWDNNIELKGKKVGIIGSGSTGVQVMTAIAPIVGKLTLFQRRAQYSVPSGQGPVDPSYRQKINADYDKIWDNVWSSSVGFGVPESTRKTMDATPEERKQAFEEVWSRGNGFRFMFSALRDLVTDEEANNAACDFIRGKIDEIVTDPRKAHILKPQELYARRPLCDFGYYQIFNRDNVDIVDLQANAIIRLVPQGVELADGTVHDVDVLIFATGFEAVDGSYTRIRGGVTGRNGRTLKDHWSDGSRAYGAVTCAGFPNMFLISGPQSPFANFPPVVECEVNFIMSVIQHAEGVVQQTKSEKDDEAGKLGDGPIQSPRRRAIMEAKEEAEADWVELCNSMLKGSLFAKTPSWILGQNIPGKKTNTNFYFAGLRPYLKWADEEASAGFPGFTESAVQGDVVARL
ncbi:hypothetical protein CORC01_12829 [Colletotrichum orchidophilum]|uniref:FAD/NAD(P)-binding domain-containing protein n=1 Tax=Colletotrichum orchidophilum TaxID=1209926 RepID=A0A1G4ARZ3_9PEZI|nr:uncharacterized protein CORC01_12829 [Colletotrichum orchidophilum]OHE91876.1 hypothetical protein CORC01_12829 [Colletotrichum orchidophilum]